MAHHPSLTPWAPIRGPNQLPQDSQISLKGCSDDWPLYPKFAALFQNFHDLDNIMGKAIQIMMDYA